MQLHYCKPLPNSNLHKTLNAYTKAHHQSCLAYNAHVSRAALTTTCGCKHNSIHFRFFNGIFNLGFLGFCRDRSEARCCTRFFRRLAKSALIATPTASSIATGSAERRLLSSAAQQCMTNALLLLWFVFGTVCVVDLCVAGNTNWKYQQQTRGECVFVCAESVQTLHHAYLRWLNLCGACNERRAYYDNAPRWDDPTTGVLSRMSTSRERWMSNLFE